jgi:hypothetical protein
VRIVRRLSDTTAARLVDQTAAMTGKTDDREDEPGLRPRQ